MNHTYTATRYVATLKDRIKLRLCCDEAADLRRDILHVPRGCDAWLALRAAMKDCDKTILATNDKLMAHGWPPGAAASRAELAAVVAVMAAAAVAAIAVVMP